VLDYTTIEAPGTGLGPCREPCTHYDCRDNRMLAASICPVCNLEIGYEVQIYIHWHHYCRLPFHAACYHKVEHDTEALRKFLAEGYGSTVGLRTK
jgi:hypothetical protein